MELTGQMFFGSRRSNVSKKNRPATAISSRSSRSHILAGNPESSSRRPMSARSTRSNLSTTSRNSSKIICASSPPSRPTTAEIRRQRRKLEGLLASIDQALSDAERMTNSRGGEPTNKRGSGSTGSSRRRRPHKNSSEVSNDFSWGSQFVTMNKEYRWKTNMDRSETNVFTKLSKQARRGPFTREFDLPHKSNNTGVKLRSYKATTTLKL